MESFLRDGVDLKGMSGRAIAGDAHFFEDSTSPAKVRQYLDSKKDSDKLKGVKWLMAMLSKGRDVSEFFPDVVKNVVVKSIEVKKMKDLAGTNPLIRGLALRVMTSIRVPDVIQIQLLAARKCSTDSSPYVRKCAATALTKIYLLDPEQLISLKQILEKLLRDSSTMVLGSAISAFNEICPNSFDILHRPYRKLCHLLADMDEWSQIEALQVMARYVRNQFTDPAPGVTAAVRLQAKQRSQSAIKGKVIGNTVKRKIVRKAFYSDEEDELDEEDVEIDTTKPELGSVFLKADVVEGEGDLDADHRLVLRSSQPLLKSRNSGVVLGVCALHYYCGSHNTSITLQIGKSLVRILRNKREIQYVVLTCINTMAHERPAIFRPFLSEFFIKSTDPVFNRLLKLEILTCLCTRDNVQTILRELQIYMKHTNLEFVCAAVKALGRVADADPDISNRCMEGLFVLMTCNKAPIVVEQTVIVLRQLIQQNPTSEISARILHQLAKLLIADKGIDEAKARASIIWLVGEYHDMMPKVTPDILRILAAGFVDESNEAKAQIVNMAIKLSLRLPDNENVQNLMTYVLEMARYDLDTDLRDRSRFMTAMMGLAPTGDQAEASENKVDEEALEELSERANGIILAAKLPPVTLLGSVDVEGLPNFNLGSLSSLVGHYASGYEPIAQWPNVQPDPNVRDAIRLGSDEAEGPWNVTNATKPKSASRKGDDSSDEDLSGFYGEKETSAKSQAKAVNETSDEDDESDDSSEESSESEDESEGKSDESSDEADGSEDEEESDEESESSEEEVVTRIPIAQVKSQGHLTRQMRKVATGKKGEVAGGLFASDASTSLIVDDLSGLSMNAPIMPTTSYTAPVDLGIQFNSQPFDDLSKQVATSSSADMANGMPGFQSVPTVTQSSSLSAFDLAFDDLSSTLIPAENSIAVDSGVSVVTNSVAPAIPNQIPSEVQQQQQQQQYLQQLNLSQPISGIYPPGQPSMQGFPVMPNQMTQIGMSPVQMGMQGPRGMMAPQQMGMGVVPGMGQNFGVPNAMGMPNMQYFGQGNMPNAMGAGMNNVMSGGPRSIQDTPVIIDEKLSEEKIILKPELGGGLLVAILYRYSANASAYAGAHCVYVLLRNCSDHTIRRIKISFPSELRRTQLEDVAQLNIGQEVKLPMEVVLSGAAGKSHRVDIRCDVGAYVGVFIPQAWDLLIPLAMTSSEFENSAKRMMGLSENTKTLSLSSLKLSCLAEGGIGVGGVEPELINRTMSLLNVYLVQGAGVGELMFSALLRKGLQDEKILVRIISDSEQVIVKVSCGDVVISTGLIDMISRGLLG